MKRWENCCNVRDISFCCIPKNGSSSIKSALLLSIGQDPGDVPNFHHHPALNRQDPELAKGYRVAVVRHPVERAISAWYDMLWIRDPDSPSVKGFLSRGFTLRMTLTKFAEHLADNHETESHLAPQHSFLAERMDEIVPLPALNDLWLRLQRARPWLKDIGRLNVKTVSPDFEPARDAVAAIEEIYSQDMAIWKQSLDEWVTT